MPATRYQEASVERAKRANGPEVWVYRWRELQSDGRRVQRKKVINDISRYPTKRDAKKAVDHPPPGDKCPRGTPRQNDRK
jgi:integrase